MKTRVEVEAAYQPITHQLHTSYTTVYTQVNQQHQRRGAPVRPLDVDQEPRCIRAVGVASPVPLSRTALYSNYQYIQ